MAGVELGSVSVLEAVFWSDDNQRRATIFLTAGSDPSCLVLDGGSLSAQQSVGGAMCLTYEIEADREPVLRVDGQAVDLAISQSER